MSGKITSCCVVLLLALTSVFGAQRKLNSIHDVQLQGDIQRLLHWFANKITIDCYGSIQLNFDLTEHGSHHYGNYDGLLERPHRGYQYYTIGNINEGSSHPWTNYTRQNKARIIVSVCQRSVDRVYITRHYDYGAENSTYDPEHTYEISTNFLRESRSSPSMYGNTSGARLQGSYNNDQYRFHPQSPRTETNQGDWLCNIPTILILIFLVVVFLALGLRVNK